MLGAVRWLILAALTGTLSAVMLPVPLLARETVAFPGGADPGTIVVRTNERKLYYVVDRYVQVLEGNLTGADGPAAVFIDIIGLPRTPLSFAGVARRTAFRGAWYGAAAAGAAAAGAAAASYYHPYGYPPPPCGYYPYPPCY
jgi:hypothetical protein